MNRDSFELDEPTERSQFLRRASRDEPPSETPVFPSLTPKKKTTPLSGSSLPIKSLAAHGALIVVYTLFSLLYIQLSRQSDRINGNWDNIKRHPALPYIVDQVTYAMQPFGFDLKSPYVGQSNIGGSAATAWDSLLAPAYINVTEAELRSAANFDLPSIVPSPMRSSEKLPSGGSVSSFGAWTELMCVRRLWEANYRDPKMSEAERELSQKAADLCVDRLRQAAMCRGDTETLTSYRWDDKAERLEFEPEMDRGRCVDWEKLNDAVQRRVVPEVELEELKRQKGSRG